jgi:hypothetical protein
MIPVPFISCFPCITPYPYQYVSLTHGLVDRFTVLGGKLETRFIYNVNFLSQCVYCH